MLLLNTTTSEFQDALELVREYGEDSLSYLTLEQGKKYFFAKSCEGFIAYVVVGRIAVCLSNPICSKEHLKNFLSEFRGFCEENKLRICLCSVGGEIVKILEQDGYCVAKYGEEAILDLSIYQTVGSSTSKLRQKLRRAEKSGIKTVEYQPQKHRDFNLEQKIVSVSEEWYADKNGRLTFTLGEINLDNPLDRRYFIAMDENEEIQAILVFAPFSRREGYFLDVMRRRKDSIPGVMEKAIIDSAMKMRDEGVSWLSLGVAPLAGIDKQEKMNLLEKCLNLAYNYMNYNYGFKTLYDYKRKFAPSQWQPRYVVYQPDLSCFQVGCAMLKARNVDDFCYQFTLGIWNAGKNSAKTAVKQILARYTNTINNKFNYER